MSGSDLLLRASCRGLVMDDDGRVLLAQHRINDETTVWVGPGGGVEDGESLVEALARELHEETGLVLTDPSAPGRGVDAGEHVPRDGAARLLRSDRPLPRRALA